MSNLKLHALSAFSEFIVENAALDWFGELGNRICLGLQLAPGEPAAKPDSFGEVVLVGRLREAIPTPDDVFGPPARISVPSSLNLAASSPNLTASSPNLGGSSPHLDGNRNADGCLIADSLALPIIDDVAALAPDLRGTLEKIAREPHSKRKVSREILIAVILKLCARHYVTLRSLAFLVNRKPEALREHYLTKLVRERKLILAFPTTPTHERQAYCAAEAHSI